MTTIGVIFISAFMALLMGKVMSAEGERGLVRDLYLGRIILFKNFLY